VPPSADEESLREFFAFCGTVTVRPSALQCVAVRCSALQCVAVCCSTLRRVAVRPFRYVATSTVRTDIYSKSANKPCLRIVCAFVLGAVQLDRVLAWFEVDLRRTSLVCALAVGNTLSTARVYDIVNMTFYILSIQGDVYIVNVYHMIHFCCGHNSLHIVNIRGRVLSI